MAGTHDTDLLSVGAHVITARVTDAAGFSGSASITVTVVESLAPTPEPSPIKKIGKAVGKAVGKLTGAVKNLVAGKSHPHGR